MAPATTRSPLRPRPARPPPCRTTAPPPRTPRSRSRTTTTPTSRRGRCPWRTSPRRALHRSLKRGMTPTRGQPSSCVAGRKGYPAARHGLRDPDGAARQRELGVRQRLHPEGVARGGDVSGAGVSPDVGRAGAVAGGAGAGSPPGLAARRPPRRLVDRGGGGLVVGGGAGDVLLVRHRGRAVADRAGRDGAARAAGWRRRGGGG